MATEEEAREAADGEEVQVEVVDIGTADLHIHLDGKLSSNKEIKDERKIMDSHEGMLKITEDQVLEEAPSVVKTPPEHTSNGTSSLNDHMEEGKNSNEKLQENDQNDKEQAEASPDGIITDQSNKSNGEDTIDPLGHVESTTKDTSLLRHENEEPKEHDETNLEGDVMDHKMVHEDTLKTDNEGEPTIDAQQGQNLELAKATEDTQPANMTCSPDEVVTEALAGVQTLEPNVDDSDAFPDTRDGNPEKVEPAKWDKESCPEDEDIAKHTYEIVKLEDQQSKQTDDVDEDMVHEEIPEINETDLSEDMPKTEQADELPSDAQEMLNQESPAETSNPVCEKSEGTSNESNMAAYEDIAPELDAVSREPVVDIQEVQNQGSVEEITDAEEVDTEKPMQQSSVAFEEVIPEDHVATAEPSSCIQHVHNVESEEIKGVEDAKAEETSNQSHASFAEDAVQDKEVLPSEPPTDIKPAQGMEQEETKDVGTVETDDASNQTHADVFNNLAAEDGVAASEPQVTVLEVVKDIEGTETRDMTHHSQAAASEEVLTEDNSMEIEPTNDDIQQALEQGSVEVTDTEVAEPDTQVICHERTISASEDTAEHEEGPTCDAQDVQNVASEEEIKLNIADNIAKVSNVAEQEKDVLTNEDIAGQIMLELEPEEIKNTEPVVIEEASDQGHDAPFSDLAQEDITPSEMPRTESTLEVKEIEATNSEANPQESNVSLSDEPTPEENITSSVTANDTQEVNNVKLAEDIEGNEDTGSDEISDQINGVLNGEAAQGTNEQTSEPTVDIQSVQDLESEKTSTTELVQVSETSHEMDSAVLENLSQEDNPTTSQLYVMESAEVSNSGTTEGQATPHQSNDAQSEGQETEESTTAIEPQIREPESLEETKELEATEPQGISDRSIVSTFEEFVPEEDATSKEPAYDNEEVQNEEPEQEHDDVKADEISNKSSGTIVGEAAHVQAKELELQEIRNTEEASHKKHSVETLTANDPQMIESSGQMTGIEPTRPEPALHGSNVASLEDIATEDNTTVAPDVGTQQVQEQDPVEFRDIEATEPEGISPSHIDSTSPDVGTQQVQEQDPVEFRDIEATEPEGISPSHIDSTSPDVGTQQVQEQDPVEFRDIEATEPEGISPSHIDSTSPDVGTQQVQEQDPVEFRDIEATEPEGISPSHIDSTSPDVGTQQVQEQDPVEFRDIEATEPEGISPSHIDSTSELSTLEDKATTEPSADTQKSATVTEDTEDVNSNVVVAEEDAPEVMAFEATINVPPELEEPKNTEPVETQDNITASDLPTEEVKDTETMENEGMHNDSTIANLGELTEDVKINNVLADEAASDEHVLATESIADISSAQEPEIEEIKNRQLVEEEDNTTASDLPAKDVKSTEAMETEPIPHECTVASISELTEDVKSNGVRADEAATEAIVDIPPVHEPEIEEINSIEPVEVEDNITASDLPEEMKGTEAMETEPIPCEGTVAGISELSEDLQSNVALPDEAAPEEHALATEPTVDIPPVQEPALEENTEPVEVEDNIIARDLPAEEMQDTEAKEAEAIPHVSIVEIIKEHNEDDILTLSATLPDIQQIPEEESVEDEKCIDTTDYQGEPQQSTVSASDELTPTEEKTAVTEPTSDIHVQNVTARDIKDCEDVKTEEFSEPSTLSAPEVVAQESVLLGSEPTTNAQQVQEQNSTEETRGIEAVQTEDDQQHGVSTLEKSVSESTVTESEPNVDGQKVQEDKSAVEVKDIGAMEHEEISTTENAAQENTELGSDPKLSAQSEQQLELAEDSKESQPAKAEETGESNGATLEEPTAEDNASNDIDPPADAKQWHGLESVEGNRDIDDTEPEDASCPSGHAASEEPASESDVATTEPTYDIRQASDLEEAKEMKGTEAINAEEICQKSEIAILEDPSPIDSGTALKEHPVESNEENLGNEINNAILVNEKIKNEIQELTEQKEDESSGLGERTIFKTQKGESTTEEGDVTMSGEDTIGTSINTEQTTEELKAVTEHDSSQMLSNQSEENIAHVQDSDIKAELLTERGTSGASQASVENYHQAAQDVADKDDTMKSGEHTDDKKNEQLHDVALHMKVCDRSVDAFTIEQQDEAVQKVNLDQQQKEDEEIEKQREEIQTDEQKHDDNNADFTTEPLSKPQGIEIGTTNRKEDDDVFEDEQKQTVATEMVKNEQTLHILLESFASIGDAKVENSTEIKEGTEEENASNNAVCLHVDAENYNEDEEDNTGKDAEVAKVSADVEGTTDENRNEEVGDSLASSTENLQNKSDPAPSDEEMLENVEDEKLATTELNGVEGEAMQHKVDSFDTDRDNDDISPRNTLPEHETETASDINQTSQDQETIKADDVVQLEPEKVALDRIAETDPNEKMETSYTAVTEAVRFDEAVCDKASGDDGALSDENVETFQDTRCNLDASPAVTASEGESMNEDKERHKLALPAQPTMDRNTTEQASALEETERELSLPEKTLPTEPEEHNEMQITKEQDEEDIHEDEVDDTQNEAKEAGQSDLPVSHFLMNLIMGKESNDPDGNSQFEEKKQETPTQKEEIYVTNATEIKVDDILIFEQEKQNLEGPEETHDFKLETDEELSQNTHDLGASVYQHNAQDEISGELVPGEAPGQVTEMVTRDFELGERPVDSISQEHMEEITQIEEGSFKSNIDDSTSPKASQENSLEEERTELLHESLPEDRSSDAVVEKTVLSTEPAYTNDLQSPLSTKQEEFTESSIEAKTTLEVQPENEVDKEEENHHSTTGGATEAQIENLHDNSQNGPDSEATYDEQKPEITEPVRSTEINLVHEKEISAGSECMEEKQSDKFSDDELCNFEKTLEMQSDGSNLHINQDKQGDSSDNQIVMENNLLDKPKQSSLQVQETDIAQKILEASDEGCQHFLDIRDPVLKEENANGTVEIHEQSVGIKSKEEQEALNAQVQERDLDVVSPKEAPEVKDTFVGMIKPEFSKDEEQSPKKDESNMAEQRTYDGKTTDEEEAKDFTDEATIRTEEQGTVQKAWHRQERDLDVVSTKEPPATEENFVHIKKPEFSTDEEQSPKKDESSTAEEKSYDEKTKDDKEAKNFTDEAAIRIEEQGAGLKASPKKHNLLSGVGSKVKHQLAKVKKAIIGKPGNAKSESPKS